MHRGSSSPGLQEERDTILNPFSFNSFKMFI